MVPPENSKEKYLQKAKTYLTTLCSVKPNRRLGSTGNRAATDFFAQTLQHWDFTIDATLFQCLDFIGGKSSLACGSSSFEIHVSPYSLSCDIQAELVAASSIEELQNCGCAGKLLLMKDEICVEQLIPKNFVFYNPDHHKKIYSLLEEKQPAAIITATRRNPESVGAAYPFPLIEDGDFDIPSVYCKDTVGNNLAEKTGEICNLNIEAIRIPTTACNVIARKNPGASEKIVVCAHIDTWGNAPGALDNASGIVVELLLSEMLAEYHGQTGIEIIAFNGEDHYSAAGQMDYLRRYSKNFDEILVAVNIDDVGYIEGKTAYSLYGCSDEIQKKADLAFGAADGMIKGEQWYQGDHVIFAQQGKAAMAITSENIVDLLKNVTHSQKDTPEVVDCNKLVNVAQALKNFFTLLSQP